MSATPQSRRARIITWLSSYSRNKCSIKICHSKCGTPVSEMYFDAFTISVQEWEPNQVIIQLVKSSPKPNYPLSTNWMWLLINIQHDELWLSEDVTLEEVADMLARVDIEFIFEIIEHIH